MRNLFKRFPLFFTFLIIFNSSYLDSVYADPVVDGRFIKDNTVPASKLKDVTTDNIPAGTTNLYYTNSLFNTNFASKLTATNGLTGISFSASTPIVEADSILGAFGKLQAEISALNLLTPNVTSVNGYTGVIALTTTDITEGTNFYWTALRFNAAFATKTTTNLSEGTNLYWTQGRFNTAFSGKTKADLNLGSVDNTSDASKPVSAATNYQLSLKANTADISAVGFSGSYLDLTNRPSGLTQVNSDWTSSSGVSSILHKPTIPSLTSQLTNDSNFLTSVPVTSVNSLTGAVSLTSDTVPVGTTNKYYLTSLFNTDFSSKTTSNLTEGSNLYWTPSRFNTSFGAKSTSDLVEGTNFYWTSLRFNTAFGGKTTTDLTEGTNLYFTDLRAVSAPLTGLSTSSSSAVLATDSTLVGIGKLEAHVASNSASITTNANNIAINTTNISSNTTAIAGKQATLTTGSSSQYFKGDLSLGTFPTNISSFTNDSGYITSSPVTSVNTLTGVISLNSDNIPVGTTNKYYLSSLFNTDFGLKNTGDLAEGSNLYYTDIRFDTSFATKSTDDLVVGTTNKYYLTSLFNTDFSSKTTDNLTQGSTNKYYSSSLFNTDFSGKSTTNLTEGTNFYYTDSRFDGRFSSKTTDDLLVGSTNLYYTNTLFNSSFSLKSTSDLTEGTNFYWTAGRFNTAFSGKSTSDLTEGSNFYYTDSRFDARLSAKTTDNLAVGSTNLYYTNSLFNTSFSGKTTSDLIEGTNYYWTPARFDTALGLKSTTDLSEGTNKYFTDFRAVSAPLTGLSTSTSTPVTATDSTLVGVGKLQSQINSLSSSSGVTSVNTRTGAVTLTKYDVGLSNNDNTSDATKNAAAVSLTNKTIDGSLNTLSNIGQSSVTGLSSSLAGKQPLITLGSTSQYFKGDLSLGTFPTNVSTFTNDAGYLTSAPVTSVNSLTGAVSLTSDTVPVGTTNKYYLTSLFNTDFSSKTTANLSELTNLYFTNARAIAAPLTGLSTSTSTAVTATDSTLIGVGKLQAQVTINTGNISTNTSNISSNTTAIAGKLTASNNLSDLTSVSTAKTNLALVKSDVGLGSVDNTSDSTKNAASVSLTNKTINGSLNTLSNIAESSVTNLTTDLSGKQSTITLGTTGQYFLGNLSLATIPTFNSLSPMTNLGDVIYGGVSGAGTRLAPNTTATKKYLSQTGTGSAGQAPVWDQPILNNIGSPTSSYSFNSQDVTGVGTITGSNAGFSSITATTGTFTNGTVNSDVITTNAASQTLSGKQYKFAETLSVNQTAEGIIETKTAGEALSFGDVVYFKSDGKVWKANATAEATAPVMAMCVSSSISANSTGNFLLQGTVRNDSWSWTIGGLIYLNTTAGTMSQTRPSSIDQVIQVMGMSHPSATTIYFNPNSVYFTHS
jgi:hypothetical protein